MTEGIEILDVPSLTKRILDHWEEKRKEALLQEKEQREKSNATIQEEKELKRKLKTSQSIVEKMQKEFRDLEAKIESERRKAIEKNTLRESDVLEGRTSLREFTAKGMTEKTISEQAIKETTEELEDSLKAIRSKNLEILELENQLLRIRVKIRFALLEPGKLLQKSLRELLEFSQHEMSIFIEEIHNSKTQLLQSESKLTLASKGQSLTPGFSWIRLNLEQAKAIIFDPCLPESLASKLKMELLKFKDGELLNVNYYIRSRTVDVTSIGGKK